MHKILPVFACLALFALQACNKTPKTAAVAEPSTHYLYIDRDGTDGAEDSLQVYDNKRFELSLGLYTKTDTLKKTVPKKLHMGIFKLNGQKFAVVCDSTGTFFSKFENGSYERILKFPSPVAGGVPPMRYKDFNGDGHTDVHFRIPAAGPYGMDDYLLFYDPQAKTLVSNLKMPLRDVRVKGNTVISAESSWQDTYTIKGTNLLVNERVVYTSQGEKLIKIVKKYNEAGKEISNETLPR
jgi:hypothetical protein